MKLVEALGITRTAAKGPPFRVKLASGFEPLHFRTFLHAHLARALPGRAVAIETGLYGDALGNVSRESDADALVLPLEWADLDARLGFRARTDWGPKVLADITETVARKLDAFAAALAGCKRPISISLPTVPMAPLAYEPTWQSGAFELGLREAILRFAVRVSALAQVRVVRDESLSSAPQSRHDLAAELSSGFPYRLEHADDLASKHAMLAARITPKKGLITDLDDTVWRGILGDVGPAGVSFDLDQGTHGHALYQAMLGALADAGVLVAVVSKNDATVVQKAFEREDLAHLKERLFPIVANWDPKSDGVATVLKAWNIGAGDVVMIDDSPMELAEIEQRHPGIECIRFEPNDLSSIQRLLVLLRDRFGKDRLTEEDRIRRQSLAAAVDLEKSASSPEMLESFLEGAQAEVTITFAKEPLDPRALELVNKTNQFNLNGRRYTESDWSSLVRREDSFLAAVSYRDKFAPLGTIAIAAGTKQGKVARIEAWVMSCRAFSRRIEHRTLEVLFDQLGVEALELHFAGTERNGPTRTLLAELLGREPNGTETLTLADFRAKCPKLHHRVHRNV